MYPAGGLFLIIDEEDSPAAVNSIGPPARQVQPGDLIGHLRAALPLVLSGPPALGWQGLPTRSPHLLLLLEAVLGAMLGGCDMGAAPAVGVPPDPWQRLRPLPEGSWPPAGQQGADRT